MNFYRRVPFKVRPFRSYTQVMKILRHFTANGVFGKVSQQTGKLSQRVYMGVYMGHKLWLINYGSKIMVLFFFNFSRSELNTESIQRWTGNKIQPINISGSLSRTLKTEFGRSESGLRLSPVHFKRLYFLDSFSVINHES